MIRIGILGKNSKKFKEFQEIRNKLRCSCSNCNRKPVGYIDDYQGDVYGVYCNKHIEELFVIFG